MSARSPSSCELAVVGGGIVGLAVARELALRRGGEGVVLLERERGLAAHQSSHSSGVVHRGVYYAPGSLKARLCVAGAAELESYCAEREIPLRFDGKLIVAAAEHQLGRLDELERRARANGVPELRRLAADEIAAAEPAACGLAALHSPRTAVVDFARVARAYAADLERAGGRVLTGASVRSIREQGGGVELELGGRAALRASAVVVCAGAFGERLAAGLGLGGDLRIVPFRGAYLELRPERSRLVRGSIYPVPDPALPFLGAHLTRGPDGRVLLGPTALIAGAADAYEPWRLSARSLAATVGWPGTWRLAARQRRAALTELSHALSPRLLVAAARRLVPELRRRDFRRGPAGVRGQAVGRGGSLIDDFVLERTERVAVVRNAPSPAATASLALARLVADELAALG